MKNGLRSRMAARLLGAGLALLPAAALAHPGDHTLGHGDSFVSGFLHPIFGADHLVVMLAIGLWAAYLGGRAVVGVPLAFIGMMIAGSVLSQAGVALPAVEQTIAASIVVFGLLICLLARLPAGPAALLVGLFASFHGFAHGAEMPDVATPFLSGAGFVMATAMLLGLGGAIGFASRGNVPAPFIRAVGAAVMAFGVVTVWAQIA